MYFIKRKNKVVDCYGHVIPSGSLYTLALLRKVLKGDRRKIIIRVQLWA